MVAPLPLADPDDATMVRAMTQTLRDLGKTGSRQIDRAYALFQAGWPIGSVVRLIAQVDGALADTDTRREAAIIEIGNRLARRVG